MKKKRYLLSVAEREKIISQIGTLHFKWSVSRGRDTYGYNICSLWIDGKKVASTCGGGYSMTGTVLGAWIAQRFPEELKKLRPADFYGLSFYDTKAKKFRKQYRNGYKTRVDGGCGMESMNKILGAIGFGLDYPVYRSANHTIFELKKAEELYK